MVISQSKIEQLKTDFFKRFNIPSFDFSVEITPDLSGRFFALRPDLKGKVTGNIADFNGTMVHPKNGNEAFHLLINQKYCDETTEKGTQAWLGTFAHEATHITDYRDYLSLSGAADYDEIRYSGKHQMFFYWTEFHARKNGYAFWQKETGVVFDEKRLQYITAQEYIFQKNYIKKKLASSESANKKMYDICQFLGRLSVWADAYPDFFVPEKIEGMLGNLNDDLYVIYNFFAAQRNVTSAVRSFGVLENILSKNFGREA